MKILLVSAFFLAAEVATNPSGFGTYVGRIGGGTGDLSVSPYGGHIGEGYVGNSAEGYGNLVVSGAYGSSTEGTHGGPIGGSILGTYGSPIGGSILSSYGSQIGGSHGGLFEGGHGVSIVGGYESPIFRGYGNPFPGSHGSPFVGGHEGYIGGGYGGLYEGGLGDFIGGNHESPIGSIHGGFFEGGIGGFSGSGYGGSLGYGNIITGSGHSQVNSIPCSSKPVIKYVTNSYHLPLNVKVPVAKYSLPAPATMPQLPQGAPCSYSGNGPFLFPASQPAQPLSPSHGQQDSAIIDRFVPRVPSPHAKDCN
ncbi:keratin, type II cytoskeletal 3-like [Bacillus rossius redtenbacheri]|uniref:keratin, type II cytoskeletal 3-like n=1 Tax=Bacillus rossius redtenbacheri TaxID=93214 RepID=UPI002FDD8D56